MPVVGKRYREIDGEFQADCKCYNRNGYVSSKSHIEKKEVNPFSDYSKRVGKILLEEIKKGKVNEVERALEAKKDIKTKQRIDELKEVIGSYRIAGFIVSKKWIEELEELQRNMSKPESKIDIQKPCVDSLNISEKERVEPVSIWKDVSEINQETKYVLLKYRNGETALAISEARNSKYDRENLFRDLESGIFCKTTNLIQYAELTDFINAFEQMQKDIEELKKKNNQ